MYKECVYVRKYERQVLLKIGSKASCCDLTLRSVLVELRLLRRVGPRRCAGPWRAAAPAPAPGTALVGKHRKRCSRGQKRGKRAGAYARLNANPHKPAVPSHAGKCPLPRQQDGLPQSVESLPTKREELLCLHPNGDLAESEHHRRCDPVGGTYAIQS